MALEVAAVERRKAEKDANEAPKRVVSVIQPRHFDFHGISTDGGARTLRTLVKRTPMSRASGHCPSCPLQSKAGVPELTCLPGTSAAAYDIERQDKRYLFGEQGFVVKKGWVDFDGGLRDFQVVPR
jgi:hypothetical protein